MANKSGQNGRAARFKNKNQKNGVGRTKARKGKPKVSGGIVKDARQRILLKKRRVGDAREILTKMARVQDARSKIQKMRETRSAPANASFVRPIGANILRKTDRNGKISLVTNKHKLQNPSDLSAIVQQQLGLIRSPIRKKRPLTSTPVRAKAVLSPLLRKTVINDVERSYIRNYEGYPYGPIPSENVFGFGEPSRLGLTTLLDRSQLALGGDIDASQWRRQYKRSDPTAAYRDLDIPGDEEMPLAVTVHQNMFPKTRSSNIHSRLDTTPLQVSHGIFAAQQSPKTKVIVPAGHRIVVSNLQATVTQEDIRELFEDIGQLLVARLVRPGTAEVIYKNLRDAQKAVETYHNRQLDGQPMKCLLVNKRPINNPTGPALTPARMEVLELISKKPPTPGKGEKVVPDLQTIHKVLFKGK